MFFYFYFFSLSIKKEKKNTHWTWLCFKIYFNIYLIIVIYFTNFINFDFISKFFFNILKLNVALNFSLLGHDIYFQSFFPSFFKADLHSSNVSQAPDTIRWQMFFFFQSSFEENKMLSLPNRFVLFINHTQKLKCVWQNSYLDLWSNTLYIIWQGVHLLVKLQARGTNK